jgi:hypothetical protein
MLTVIRCHEERDDAAFAAFILSAAAAANGRDQVAAAPSLPSGAAVIRHTAETNGVMAEPGVTEVALALAGLSDLLASRLAAATAAAGPADREACLHAARHATRIGALLGGAREP